MPFAGAVDWLGATVDTGSRKAVLPTAVKNALVKAFAADVVTEADVPLDGSLEASAMGAELKLWQTALVQQATAEKIDITDLDKVRFEQWLTSRLAKPKDVTPIARGLNDQPIQEEMKADLSKQGMILIEEMAGLELSLYLGRPGARGELEGYEYGKPATHMVGAIREKKTGAKVGWLSIDEVVAAGLAAHDASDLTLFVQELAGRLSRSELLKSYKSSANSIQTWYNVSRNSIADDDVLLTYIKLYRGQYQGRGLVVEFDAVLYIGAENKVKAMRAKKGKTLDLSDLASTVSGSSLASTAYPETSISMQSQAQMGQVMSAVSGISAMLQAMQTRLDALEGAAPAAGGDGDNFPCWRCGSTAHKKENCPLHLQEQADKKKKAADKEKADKAAAAAAAKK